MYFKNVYLPVSSFRTVYNMMAADYRWLQAVEHGCILSNCVKVITDIVKDHKWMLMIVLVNNIYLAKLEQPANRFVCQQT